MSSHWTFITWESWCLLLLKGSSHFTRMCKTKDQLEISARQLEIRNSKEQLYCFTQKCYSNPLEKAFIWDLYSYCEKKNKNKKPHSDPLAYYWFYCYVTYWIATIQSYLLCNRPPSFIPSMELLFDLQGEISGHFEVEQGPGWSCTFGLMPSLRDPAVHDESTVACHFESNSHDSLQVHFIEGTCHC